ncbi:hypothetical protein [Micrococcus luteus]|uniref:hypothetical protein n=1 Tax=Micrococcus luteus TaxID=1270 RepID=UPI0037FA10B5
MDQVHEQKARLEKLERSTDLTHSAVDSGGIVVKDAEGNPRVIIGQTESGVVTTQYANGPIPNEPSLPTVEAEVGSVNVTWDGLDAGGNPAPEDFKALNIYASVEPDFEPGPGTYVGVLSVREGGTKTVALPYGTWHLRTALYTLSGQTGPFSPAVSARVLSVVELPDVAEEFAQGREEMEALGTKLAEADVAIKDAKGRIDSAENQLADLGLDSQAISDRLTKAEGDLATQAQETADEMADLASRLQSNTTDLSDARTRLAEAETVLAPLPGDLETIRRSAQEAATAAQKAQDEALAAQTAATEANARALTAIPNGSFEEDLANWVVVSGMSAPAITTESYVGGKAARFGNSQGVAIHKSLPVVGEQIWEVSAYYKNKAGTAPNGGIFVEFTDAQDVLPKVTKTITTPDTSKTTWSKATLRVTVPANMDHMTLRISYTTGDVIVDEVTVRDVTDVVRLEKAAQDASAKAQNALDSLKTLEGKVNSIQLAQDGLKTRLGDAETAITNSATQAATDLSALDKKLRGEYKAADSNILADAKADTKNKYDAVQGQIGTINTSLSAAQSAADQAKALAAQLGKDQSALEGRVTQTETDLANATAQASADLSTLDTTLRQAFQAADASTLTTATSLADSAREQAIETAINDASAKDAVLKTILSADAQAKADSARQAAISAAAIDAKSKADKALADAKAAALITAKAEAQREADEAQKAAEAYALAQSSGASSQALADAKAYAERQAQEAKSAAQAFATAQAVAEASAAQAEATRLAALDAQKRASDAQTAAQNYANSLPKVLHGTTTPTGTAPTGSVWFQHAGSITGSVIGQWVSNNGQWVSTPISSQAIANLDVGKLTAGSATIDTAVLNKVWADLGVFNRLTAGSAWIGGAQIKDGEITAPKIYASQELVAKILGVETAVADVLAVNKALWAKEAVIDALYANMFAAKKITAEHLAVHPGNLFPDPDFREPISTWTQVDRGIEKWGNGAQSGNYMASAINVRPGDVLRLEGVRKTLSGPVGTGVTMHYQKRATPTDKWVYGGAALRMNGEGLQSAELTIPSDVAQIRFGFHTETTTTSQTQVRISDVRVQSMTTGILLKDGTVNANHINATDSLTAKVLGAETAVVDTLTANQALWAKAAQILKLDVGNLTVTGTTSLNDAVANRIFADIFRANKITAGQIAIAPGELVADPYLADSAKYWTGPGTVLSVTDHPTKGKVNAVRFIPNGNRLDQVNIGNEVPVEPGDEYLIEGWVKVVTAPTTGGRFGFGLRGKNKSGGALPVESLVTYSAGQYPVGTWKPVSGTVTIPEGVVSVEPCLTVDAPMSGGQILLTGMSLVPKVGGTLIKDGSVTSEKIVASKELTAKVLSAESAVVDALKVNKNLWAEAAQVIQLDAANLTVTDKATISQAVIDKIWAQSAVVERLTAGEAWIGETVIKDGAITAPKIRADAVEASHIKARAIKADHMDFVSVDPSTGGAMSLDSSGIRLEREGSTIFQLTNASVDTISLIGADGVNVAGMSNDGSVTGLTGTFDELNVGGMNLNAIMEEQPRGIVARTVRDSSTGARPSISSDHIQPVMRMEFPVRGGYTYEIRAEGLGVYMDKYTGTTAIFYMYSAGDNNIAAIGDSATKVRATALTPIRSEHSGDTAPVSMVWHFTPSEDYVASILIGYSIWRGSEPVRINCASTRPFYLTAREFEKVVTTGKSNFLGTVSAGNTSTENVAAPRRETQTWTASAAASWAGGSRYSTDYAGSTNDLWQGYWSGSPNARMSHINFNGLGDKGKSIASTRGKITTLEKLEVYLYNSFFYYYSGGKVRLHYHNSTTTSAYPSSTSYIGDVKMGRGEGKWIEITNSNAKAAFLSGGFTGIALDPRGSKDQNYYGAFKGMDGGKYAPKIRATYLTT